MTFNYMYILASVLFNKSILRKDKRKRRRRRGGHKRTKEKGRTQNNQLLPLRRKAVFGKEIAERVG